MREGLFILTVLFVLLALTAIRYRKHIVGMIGLARALNDAKNTASQAKTISPNASTSVQLVNCAKCGVWVPQNKAIPVGQALYFCSVECKKQGAAV
jgi:hypothetical protein